MPPDFFELSERDGYLPIAAHGLIGDGHTAALVGADGAITWLCVPRFDSPPLFCGILDRDRGGEFRLSPTGAREARQFYDGDSAVLITEVAGDGGRVRLTDALALHSEADLSMTAPTARRELIRVAEAHEGPVDLEVSVAPRGGASDEPADGGLVLKTPDAPPLHVVANRRLDGLRSTVRLEPGERLELVLGWDEQAPDVSDAEGVLERTRGAWRDWLQCFRYVGPSPEQVKRSAITLKLLDHTPNGAMVAAPTSSLPEWIGGERNWDYRYTWIRDAAFSVYALRRIGLNSEAEAFLRWVLDTVEHAERPEVMYDLDGAQPPQEWIDSDLSGYRGSQPVRWGNDAAFQRQNDVYGEILDCAYQFASLGGEIDSALWRSLRALVERAEAEWHEPDHGIWEVRSEGRVFTYSAAMCQVALDRGARLAHRHGLDGDAGAWRIAADRIVDALLSEAWDPKREAITEAFGGGGLDASVLSLPLRRVIDARHPRMVSTVDAVRRELGDGSGLLHRYDPEISDDGLEGEEGAFLLCSFWLVDNLALQGRMDEAGELFESLCGLAGPQGLLPEQIDPSTGEFLGNYPQAFSHVGLISSGVNLARRSGETDAGAFTTASEAAGSQSRGDGEGLQGPD